MSGDVDIMPALARALSGRYDVVREIGRGGMGIVYEAIDRRHDRKVAVKVIRPELAGVAGPARFLREIAVVAHLDHPHIVGLYDSGEVDGLPYYIMPCIDGESLDDLMKREGQLAIEEAVELTVQVAQALDYAHGRSVVHRDIKPQNILLSNGQAVVADFGLAGALSDAGGEKLTLTGLAIGSPHYMSPEQADGSGHVDARSDIYSLGCVLYELLIGQPPFSGSTRQAIIARHCAEPVPSLRVVRSTISPDLERVVMKALAKTPADRFRTAREFAEALRRSLMERRATATVMQRTRNRLAGLPLAVPIAAGVGAVALAFMLFRNGPRDPRPDGHVIAVLPFHFTGAVDTSVASPHGVSQLLSARLSAPGVISAADPELIEREVRGEVAPGERLTERDARELAGTLGADLVLLGTLHGSQTRMVLGGTLLAVETGEILHRVESLSGAPDSLVWLLDRFAVPILLQRVNENWRRPEDLATQPLEAVKFYVGGVEKHRRGRYAAAAADFDRALQVDPRFTLARLKLGVTHRAAGNIESALQALDDSWTERGSLAREDSMFLVALLGERHPAPTSYADQLEDWEWVADSVPRQWEASYELGDMLLHWGPAVGKEVPRSRARIAFQRALEIDSAFAPALEHLVDVAAADGNIAELRRLVSLYLAANPLADHADYARWRLAIAVGDTRERAAIRRRFVSVPRTVLEQIAGMAQLDGVALDDATLAVEELRRRSRSDYELWTSGLRARQLALNQGRPSDIPRGTPEGLFSTPLDELHRVIEALYWSGDSAAAARVVMALADSADAPVPPSASAGDRRHMMMCAVSLWRAARGDERRVATALSRLRAVRGAADQRVSMYLPVCLASLEAWRAARHEAPTSDRALQRLDSVLRSGPITNFHIQLAARHTLAELRERQGDHHDALAAVRLRPYHHAFGPTGLSESLRLEGRLAALAGDTAGAIRSLRHFLALRADAEPPFARETEVVRQELARLSGSPVR